MIRRRLEIDVEYFDEPHMTIDVMDYLDEIDLVNYLEYKGYEVDKEVDDFNDQELIDELECRGYEVLEESTTQQYEDITRDTLCDMLGLQHTADKETILTELQQIINQ